MTESRFSIAEGAEYVDYVKEPGKPVDDGLNRFRLENVDRQVSSARPDDVAPYTSQRHITKEEIDGLSYGQKELARNEIYARHAYFPTREDLRDHFMAQGYKLDPRNNPVLNKNFSESSLNFSPVERQNIKALADAQNAERPAVKADKLDAINAVPKTDDGRIVGHRPYSADELKLLDAQMLRYMRNEIAAGSGFYDWSDKNNLDAFAKKTWYTPGKDNRTPDEVKIDEANTRLFFEQEVRRLQGSR